MVPYSSRIQSPKRETCKYVSVALRSGDSQIMKEGILAEVKKVDKMNNMVRTMNA